MKYIFAGLLASCLLIACNSTKKSTPAMSNAAALAGTWELNYISGPRIAFDGLYSNKKPAITFDVVNKSVSGNTSCNNFNGPLKVEGNKISFTDPMAMTRMMCEGEGETVFLAALKKIDAWSITDGSTLNLIMGDIATMRFTKK
jgi:heat shock protein HslJ